MEQRSFYGWSWNAEMRRDTVIRFAINIAVLERCAEWHSDSLGRLGVTRLSTGNRKL